MDKADKPHEEKETLQVDVNLPAHAPRTATALFERTRKLLITKAGGRCHICGRTAAEVGPLEAHHFPIERSLAEAVDWGPKAQIRLDFPQFDWAAFDKARDPYLFVDDMTINGLLLCKPHHTGVDEGIHMLPHPLWIAQRYAREGYQFSGVEIIHHAQGDGHA
jgi:hypothetical protein